MKIIINCLNCEKECSVDKKEINRGNGKFCSRKCCGEYRTKNTAIPTPNVVCAYCEMPFYKNTSKKRNSKSGLHFCSREHKDMAQKSGNFPSICPSHYGKRTRFDDSKHYRGIVFAVKPKICERCGFDKHEAAIIVHHKDRNRMNDNLDNLEVLCWNCHIIEHYEN
ncbi:MAG TPA: HNH endonuclease signature motif containing protein [Candidatus Babeliales bacterium]|nr:HNH endonuclease signature motif containing protein [Candidatus Babeliales bacterium]